MRFESATPWVARENDYPDYRVVFWSQPTVVDVPAEQVGYVSDEWRVIGAAYVDEVVKWADSDVRGRLYTLYCEFTVPGTQQVAVARLAGEDPTAGEWSRMRPVQQDVVGAPIGTGLQALAEEVLFRGANGSPYRDYLKSDSPSIDPHEQTRTLGRSPAYGDHSGSVSIMPVRGTDVWRALWQGDQPDAPIDSFEGDRESAIKWSQDRCDDVMIYSEESADFFPL